MCDHEEPTLVRLGSETRHIEAAVRGYVGVDACISEEVAHLNREGVRTLGSCCGHAESNFPGHPWIAFLPADLGIVNRLGYVASPATWPNHVGQLEVEPMSGGGRG